MDSEVILFYINGIHSNLGPAHDNDHQIIQKMVITITSAQSEHILSFLYLVSSLVSVISTEGVTFFLHHVQVLILVSTWCSPSPCTHLVKQMKQRFWVHVQHPRLLFSFQTLRTGEELGGEKAKGRSWGTGQLRDWPHSSQWALGSIGFGYVPSFPPLVTSLFSCKWETVVEMGMSGSVRWTVSCAWPRLNDPIVYERFLSVAGKKKIFWVEKAAGVRMKNPFPRCLDSLRF